MPSLNSFETVRRQLKTHSLVETSARDLLREFLLSLDRKPLDVFLSCFMGRSRPAPFQNMDSLLLPSEDVAHSFESEGRKSATARTDLLIKSDRHVLVVEVKVGAEESLNQYQKYEEAYQARGYKTHVVGLINRIKTQARIKHHEPFMRDIKRLLWSELLQAFSDEFGSNEEYASFVQKLKALDPKIGVYSRPLQQESNDRSVLRLGKDTEALHLFYEDFSTRLEGYKTKHFQAGSTGYELHIGKPEWADLFNEPMYYRISMALNPYSPRIQRLHQEPYFAFCVLLWNRSTFKVLQEFLRNGSRIAEFFHEHGVALRADSWRVSASVDAVRWGG